MPKNPFKGFGNRTPAAKLPIEILDDSPLLPAVEGQAYRYTFKARNVTGTAEWEIIGAPAEIRIDSNSGEMTIVSVSPGAKKFKIMLTDSGVNPPESVVKTFELPVNPAPKLEFTSSKRLGKAKSGASFKFQLKTVNNNGAVIYSLPTAIHGLTLDATTGEGTLTASTKQVGTLSFIAEARDVSGQVVTATFEIEVELTPRFRIKNLAAFPRTIKEGEEVTFVFEVENATGSTEVSLTNSVPVWIMTNPTARAITIKPSIGTKGQAVHIDIEARDNAGHRYPAKIDFLVEGADTASGTPVKSATPAMPSIDTDWIVIALLAIAEISAFLTAFAQRTPGNLVTMIFVLLAIIALTAKNLMGKEKK